MSKPRIDEGDHSPSAVAWLAYFLTLIGAIIALLAVHFGHLSA